MRTCDVFRLPPWEEDLAGLTSSFPFLARDRDGISKDTLGVVVVGGLVMEVSLGIEKAKKKTRWGFKLENEESDTSRLYTTIRCKSENSRSFM